VPGSIVGPRAKVWRAAQHKAALEEAMDAWLALQPFGVYGLEDPTTGWFETRIREHELPPIMLGTIFGDFVSNLESALDLLIFQLVLASGNTPSSGNYFPVTTSERRWEQILTDKLRGVRSDLAARIKDVMPFGEDPKATGHPLLHLHTANKINKHHVITPFVVSDYAITPKYAFNREAVPGDKVIADPHVVPPSVGSKLVDDQLLGRLRAVSPRDDLRITGIIGMEPGSLGVAFEIPIKFAEEPNLIEFVAGVIDKFEDVLGVEGATRPGVKRYPPGRHDDR
jgi:hypothetical protein